VSLPRTRERERERERVDQCESLYWFELILFSFFWKIFFSTASPDGQGSHVHTRLLLLCIFFLFYI
jgi:hypothetical protein